MKVASSSDSTHGTTTRGDDADSTLSRLPAITCLGRRRTPRNQCKQRGLHRQAHNQRPVRNAKQLRILQHVDVCWRHRQRQDEQANTCRAARLASKQPGSTQQLEHATHQHRRSWPRNVRWHDPHFRLSGRKMRDAAQEKPQEYKHDTGDSPAAQASQ